MPNDTEEPKDLVQSVARALRILDIVAGSKEPVRAQWIASEVKLHLATTSHLLATLVHVGYLERNERTYKVAAGKVLDLRSRLEDEWRPSPLARSLLKRVVEATGESAYLSAWQSGTVTVVAVEEGSHAVRVADLRVGASGHIHARASGKALLAFGPEAQLERVAPINGELARRTEHTITSLPDLLADLKLISSRGHALDHQEYVLDVCAMAVPIFEGLPHPCTALSITVPLIASQIPSISSDASMRLWKPAAEESSHDHGITQDSGNNPRSAEWNRMIDHADQLAVPTTTMEDRVEAALLTLQGLDGRAGRERRRGGLGVTAQSGQHLAENR